MQNREAWLERVARIVERDLFKVKNIPCNPFKVSTGFPAGGSALKRIGECWFAEATKDGIAQVFINPTIENSSRAIDILIHEMIHVAYPTAGHKGNFKKAALALGLTGKMTATTAGPELSEWILDVIEQVGEYPHAQILLSSRKKQRTRMVKMECMECGYIVRTAQKWLDQSGPTICPCNNETMAVE